MEHYEVREMFHRSTRPDLSIKFLFDKLQTKQMLRYAPPTEHHSPVGMTPIISNSSNEPSLYAVVLIYVDTRLTVLTTESELRAPQSGSLSLADQQVLRK
jgi:hypothetical protein